MDKNQEDLIAATVAELPLMMFRREVADVLRCEPKYISQLIESGELEACQRRLRKGVPILVPRAAVRAYGESLHTLSRRAEEALKIGRAS